MEGLPQSRHEEVIDQFCLTYPVWFFELLTEVAPDTPTVLEEYQIAYLLDESRFKITNKTRQAGGSLIIAGAKFVKAYFSEGYNCDVVSINRAEAQGKITYVRNMWESLPKKWQYPLSVDNTEKIGFHKGRRMSTIRSIAASAGVRGGKKDIVFDEAAHIPPFQALFTAAAPATVRGMGAMDIMSTPMGMQGLFWELFTNQQNKGAGWSRHEFLWIDVSFFCRDIHEARRVWEHEYAFDINAIAQGGPIYEAYGLPEFRQIGDALTTEEFLQEFCGQFIDESTAYFPYAIINQCRVEPEKQPNVDDVLEPWVKRPEDNEHEVRIGIDFAEGKKGGDSTSIQLYENAEGVWKHRFYEDLDAGKGWDDFDKQLQRINEIIGLFNPQRVTVDETGLGRKLAQDLKKVHGGLIDPLTFTNTNKEEMAQNLKGLLERRSIWLQAGNERLRGQIHNVKRTITSFGNVQYSGKPHDDMFWATCLAVRGGHRTSFRVYTLHD